MKQRYISSWTAYRHSTNYLAQGSSTSSKIPTLVDAEPAGIIRGKGCRVYDADGNEYIDFRNALGPVTLGYAVPEIDDAICEQLKNGIIFGHPHPLEGQVAELLTETIPCAERVRFLKTGGEAIAACIKIARGITGRNRILHCGYNGWLNMCGHGGFRPAGIANSQPMSGVPAPLAQLHEYLPWGDLESWAQAFSGRGSDIAAVVIACDYANMKEGKTFLPAIRKLTQQHGSLMILDEIVTGFRLAIGGAQEYFNVMPDMAVFSKGMANGMPISAYLGRADLIDSARTFGISSTFGGETLSLAAAKATILFYQERNVIDHLASMGKRLWSNVANMFRTHGLPATVQGIEVCPALTFENTDISKRFFAACYAQGVSLYNVPYVNYSHTLSDIEQAEKRIDTAIRNIMS